MTRGVVGGVSSVVLVSLALAGSALLGQASDAAAPRAVVVADAEITRVMAARDTAAVADAVLRVLPIGNGQNVGVSVVRRSQVHGRTPPDAIVHDAVTEVYHVLEGRGVLVTGGTIEGARQLPAADPLVRDVIGPSAVGTVIQAGTRHRVGPGDVVVIPAGTPHGFVEISTRRIVYLLVRIDPTHVLRLRDAAR